MYRFLLVIGLIGLVLSACSASSKGTSQLGFVEAYKDNPLMAETMADLMIEYITDLQIAANERKKPISDPAILRAMDDTFIVARRMRDDAHKKQDEGKRGGFHGVLESYVEGEVLLHGEKLYFGYNFRSDVVRDLRVILSKHVAPSTEAELEAEPSLDLGPLQNIVGPQEYQVGKLSAAEWNQYRTVTLYSPSMKSVMGFAQLRGKVLEE